MNLVDSSGWLEYLAGTPLSDKFAAPIEDTARLVIPTIVQVEVCRRLLQQKQIDLARETASQMRHIGVTPLDAPLAWHAARVGVEFRLALADSIILATARSCNATLWTADSDFKKIEGVKYYPQRRRKR
jgi:toxin FitB